MGSLAWALNKKANNAFYGVEDCSYQIDRNLLKVHVILVYFEKTLHLREYLVDIVKSAQNLLSDLCCFYGCLYIASALVKLLANHNCVSRCDTHLEKNLNSS